MRSGKLIAFFYSGQMLDVITTAIAIQAFNFFEANPIARSLFSEIGMEEAMVIKLVISYLLVVLYGISLFKQHRLSRSLEKSLQIASVGVWITALFNFSGIIRA